MRFWIDDKELVKEIEQLKTSVPAAGKVAMQSSAKELAYRLRDRVVALIPNDGGWYDIYKKSIVVVEVAKDRFEVEARVNEIDYGSIVADRSLIWISSGDDVAGVLSQHSPWTLDTIPAVTDGFSGDMLVRPSSESETDFHRRARLAEMIEIRSQLATIGRTPQAFDATLPKINGKVLADVPFLAQRLEYGLGGFPRTIIWGRLDAEVAALSKSSSVTEKGRNVFSARWRQK